MPLTPATWPLFANWASGAAEGIAVGWISPTPQPLAISLIVKERPSQSRNQLWALQAGRCPGCSTALKSGACFPLCCAVRLPTAVSLSIFPLLFLFLLCQHCDSFLRLCLDLIELILFSFVNFGGDFFWNSKTLWVVGWRKVPSSPPRFGGGRLPPTLSQQTSLCFFLRRRFLGQNLFLRDAIVGVLGRPPPT